MGDDGCPRLSAALMEVKRKLSSTKIQSFNCCKSSLERILFVINSKCINDALPVDQSYQQKNHSEAKKFRLDGNNLFKKKRFQDAILLYNKGALVAPSGEEENDNELALVMANRSAALFHLEEYESCIQDIIYALKCGYPRDKQHKLYGRLGNCYNYQRQKDKATEAFLKAKELLCVADIDVKERDKCLRMLQKDIDQIPIVKGKLCNPPKYSHGIPPLDAERSSRFKYASKTFDVAYNEQVGRYAIATEDIHVGDVVVVETSYASVLFHEFRLSHCQHCFKRVEAPFPCPSCSGVVYCSEQCQQDSWNMYHHIECKFLGILTSSWLGRMGHLALRIAIVTGYKEILNYSSESHDTSGYSSIKSLISHENAQCADSLFQMTFIARFLLKVCQCSGFVEEDGSKESAHNLVVLGESLLHHLNVIQCNAFAISEMRCKEDLRHCKPIDIGLGVYPTIAMVNHSCDSSVDFFFHGNIYVCRAMKNIKPGEEISVDYGCSFYTQPRSERQVILKSQYFFDCCCRACDKDWPLWKDIECSLPQFLCEKCSNPLQRDQVASNAIVNCVICKHQQNMSVCLKDLGASHDKYKEAMDIALRGNISQALPILLQHLTIMQKLIALPWRDFISCQATIKQCYGMMGNIYITKS